MGIMMKKQWVNNKQTSLIANSYVPLFFVPNKKIEEKEIQKAIKEKMIEEEKVRREIEREKAKIEKDQNQFNAEINRLMGYMQKSGSDVEKQLIKTPVLETAENSFYCLFCTIQISEAKYALRLSII